MSKTARVLVLAGAVLSLMVTSPAAATALSWTNAGDTTFTATGTASSLATSTGTLSCTGADLRATAGTSHPGPTWTNVISGISTFNGCRIGGTTYAFRCTFKVDARSLSSNVTSGALNVTAPACYVSLAGVELCGFLGATPVRYTNPSGTTVAGVLAIDASSTLTVVNGSGGTCPLGNSVAVTWTASRFTVTTGSGSATYLGPYLSQP